MPAGPGPAARAAWRPWHDDGRARLRRGPARPPRPAADVATSTIQQVDHRGPAAEVPEPARRRRPVRPDRVRPGPDREDHRLAQLGKTIETMHRPAHAARGRAHPRHLHHRPAGRDPADDRGRVRPVPRPAADPPRQHHRRASKRSAASAWTPGQPGPAWILPTVVTAVLDVRPACVPGRSVIIYRLGPERPSCSQASVRRACGSAGCDRSAQGSEADEEGRPSVVDDRLAGGEGARRGGPVPAPA